MTVELLAMFCLALWSVVGACVLTAYATRRHYREYVDHLERLLWCYRITGKDPATMPNAPRRPADCADPASEKSPRIDLSPEARLARKQLREQEKDPKRTMIRNARERGRSQVATDEQ